MYVAIRLFWWFFKASILGGDDCDLQNPPVFRFIQVAPLGPRLEGLHRWPRVFLDHRWTPRGKLRDVGGNEAKE